MRIAFHVGRFPSTSETFILDQIIGLLDRGHAVDIFTRHAHGDEVVHPEIAAYRLDDRTRHGPPVNGAGRRRLLRHPLFRRLGGRASRAALRLREGRRLPPGSGDHDIVHAQFGPLGVELLQGLDLGWIRGRLVTSFRGYDATKVIGSAGPAVYRRLFERGDRFLAVSERIRDRLIELGAPPDRVHVHRSGVRCDRFPFRPRRRAEGDPVRLVTVGRLVEKKGTGDAIRAAGQLAADGHPVRLEVVGDGPLRPALERAAAASGLGDSVRFHGALPRDRVCAVLEAGHILLAPSVTARDGDEEGIPNAIKEAMALGLPVVATRHGGIPELVRDGDTGLLVPEGDAGALAAAVDRLIGDAVLGDGLATAARGVVEAEYDHDRLVDALVGHYRAAIDR